MVKNHPPQKNQDFNHGSKVGVLVHPKAKQGASFTLRQIKSGYQCNFLGLAPTNNTYIIGLGYWSFVGCFIETSNIVHIFQCSGVCGDLRPKKSI
jgi:hypothetical protein